MFAVNCFFLFLNTTAEVTLIRIICKFFHPALTRTHSILVAVLAVWWTVMALAPFGIVAQGAGGATTVMQHQVTALAAEAVRVCLLAG